MNPQFPSEAEWTKIPKTAIVLQLAKSQRHFLNMSVADNFKSFRSNYLIPAEVVESISYRYKRITKQLNKDFWNTESETAHSLYVGSYGRDTAANGVSDLDVAFTLPNAVYYKYNAYSRNGQSALLQEVRKSIERTYASSYVGGDGQVVAPGA